ncbi:MAG: acetate--CoA ligase family protein [Desulfobacterales bacterium]
MKSEIRDILGASQKSGWVLEPDAKRILDLTGFDVPRSKTVQTPAEATDAASTIGYPVVAKVVSPDLIHKSDTGGVVVGIENDHRLIDSFNRFSKFGGFEGMLVEEMVSGVELIIGAKIDRQFGLVILLGFGGTAAEIYQDTSLRMAPLTQSDVHSMMRNLKAYKILEGYRGSEPIHTDRLVDTVKRFSGLMTELGEQVDSFDLNPVICSSERCVVADARIILKKNES